MKVALAFLALAGCAAPRPAQEMAAPQDPPRFHSELLEIARTYRSFGRVDDETRWAPWLCRMPMPSRARFSESKNAETHGQKLYFLFAKQRDLYLKAATEAQPAGQVLVKEAWIPEEVKDEKQDDLTRRDQVQSDGARGAWLPFARRDGRLHRASKVSGLFILYKADPAAADTDAGWVYGTLTADGKTVTSAGRVESCISCHRQAAPDRLFGLPKK